MTESIYQQHKLTTADDVKKWIPNIQAEIEYLLQVVYNSLLNILLPGHCNQKTTFYSSLRRELNHAAIPTIR